MGLTDIHFSESSARSARRRSEDLARKGKPAEQLSILIQYRDAAKKLAIFARYFPAAEVSDALSTLSKILEPAPQDVQDRWVRLQIFRALDWNGDDAPMVLDAQRDLSAAHAEHELALAPLEEFFPTCRRREKAA